MPNLCLTGKKTMRRLPMGTLLMRLLAQMTSAALLVGLLQPAINCATPAPPMAMNCCRSMGNSCRAHSSEGPRDCCQHLLSNVGSPSLTLPQALIDGHCALARLCFLPVTADSSTVLMQPAGGLIAGWEHPPPLRLFVVQGVFRI